MLFKVRRKADAKEFHVYAVNNPIKEYQTTRFLVYMKGDSQLSGESGNFIWVDSNFYEPAE